MPVEPTPQPLPEDDREVSAVKTIETLESAPWLSLIEDGKRVFRHWQEKCDSIDKLYADLEFLSGGSVDREFQIFWANLEVLKPSIYSRPPVPLVSPRYRDRKAVPREASELLERALTADFEIDDIDATMLLLRDDLAITSRAVAWVRYEPPNPPMAEQAIVEHVDREDFLHAPARKWKEVDWVARRSWLTRSEGVRRFGDRFLDAEFSSRSIGDKKDGDYKGQEKAQVWEIWHKTQHVVVWVSPSVDEVLDLQPPAIEFDGFFPCPRPAYGTIQRKTMIPVPDFVYYRDQVEEINVLTRRISALAESLRMRGFYPGGANDVSQAVQAAMDAKDDGKVLVPVNNFAAFGGESLRNSIVWLPVGEIAQVIAQLIELRRQMIDDVYQITGLSDIMRGATEASETLGAQVLKSQYGSVRIRDKQQELVRLARDITRLKAEIFSEAFSAKTLLDMSQLSTLPPQQQIDEQIAQIQQQVAAARDDPRIKAIAAQHPEQVQKLVGQAKEAINKLREQPTIEKVMGLLRNEKLRPFVLEIETDSTIQPDEDREKQRRVEFLTAIGGFVQQAGPLVMQTPPIAPFVAEALKFVASGFRAGRELDATIDEFAETVKAMGSREGQTPQDMQAAAEAEKAQAETAKTAAETDKVKAETAKLYEEMKADKIDEIDQRNRELDQKDRALDLEEERMRREFDRANEDRNADLEKHAISNGFPPGYSHEEERAGLEDKITALADALDEALSEIANSGRAQADALNNLANAMTAPKMVVRDNEGRATGVRTATQE